MANKVAWFEVIGKDGDSLQEFYGKLFDWKFDNSTMPGYGMTDAADTGIGGGVGGAQEGQGGHLTFYVEVDNVQAALDKAQSLGGKTVAPPMQVPGGPEIATFSDPEGHMVGLFKSQPM